MQTSAATIAVKAERDRIAAIIALPEAKGREGLARTLATTGLTVDQARAALAAAPIDPAAVSAMWDSVLASRGMRTGAQALGEASAWDDIMARKGFTVGAGA
jgi:hypothetical protein